MFERRTKPLPEFVQDDLALGRLITSEEEAAAITGDGSVAVIVFDNDRGNVNEHVYQSWGSRFSHLDPESSDPQTDLPAAALWVIATERDFGQLIVISEPGRSGRTISNRDELDEIAAHHGTILAVRPPYSTSDAELLQDFGGGSWWFIESTSSDGEVWSFAELAQAMESGWTVELLWVRPKSKLRKERV